MSDTRKCNRRGHRYQKRMYERLFCGMSAKEQMEAGKAAAIKANRQAAQKKAA